MKLHLVFVRHGESEANIQHIISNRESPYGLTALGRQQAQTLATSLKEIPFTAIYSSPVLRARETAEILSQVFGVPYEVTEALREYDCGILEEKSDAESWKLHREIAEDWTLNRNYLRKPEGGECYLDIKERFNPFIEGFVNNGLHAQDHILLVSHGGLLQLMLPEVLANIDHTFVRSHGIGHTQCIIAEFFHNELICKQWGELQF